MRSALSLCLVITASAACSGPKAPPTTPAPTPTPTPTPDPVPDAKPEPAPPGKPVTTATLASIGLDPDAMDRKADPCEDFYQFTCGGWMAKTEIPADKPRVMRSFIDIEDRNTDLLHGLFDKLIATPDKDPGHAKIAAYYGACMDEATIDKVGLAPIPPLRAPIDRVTNVKTLTAAVASLHAAGYFVLFNMGSTQDAKNAKNVIIGIDQGGLGLPDRDYYLKDGADEKAARAAYATYIETVLVMLGHKADAAKSEAQAIIALETEIAKVSKDRVERRKPEKMYNKIDKAGVAKAMPSFDWSSYWTTVGLAKVNDVDVTSPEFLAGIDKLLGATKPDVWKAYLTFHLANMLSSVSTSKLEQAAFALEKALSGTEQMEPRWKRCVAQTTAALADLVGQLYVKERFGPESKTAAESYVHAISDAMADNLGSLPWMDAATKAKANEKRTAMAYQIGYPKKWRNYDYKVDKKTFTADAIAASRAGAARDFAKAGKPVDLDDWDIPASLVNAFYSGNKNYMMFPAGILQTPFYSVAASVPVNLGAMGMVVGHEMTHGFDDQGSKFDAAGNMSNWWQDETRKKFDERTKCVIDQYSQYKISGVNVNGARTVGENIADIGGVKLALAAMRKLRSSATDTVVADGFTEDQQFFISFGQIWCAKARPDFEKMRAATDTHSPPRWRINGVVSDTPDFAKAFHCKAGQAMAPPAAKQCVVW